MNFLKQLTNRSSSNNNVSSPMLLLAGGALGVLGTYLFMTDAGARHRGRIKDKLQQLAARSKDTECIVRKDAGSLLDEGNSKSTTEATPVSKAQNMVNHLKDAHHS